MHLGTQRCHFTSNIEQNKPMLIHRAGSAQVEGVDQRCLSFHFQLEHVLGAQPTRKFLSNPFCRDEDKILKRKHSHEKNLQVFTLKQVTIV